MDFKEIIKRHLDKMAQQDFAFAERYKLESKNINDCCKYITSQAKKQAKNGCAAIEMKMSETDRKLMKEKRLNDAYIKRRKRFYDMVLTDGLIECRVLPNIPAFREEANEMHHCVYTCEYYKKPYSLIMSATIKGKRIETVEVDLSSFTIKQSFGKHDQFTMHHQRILDLVNGQMNIIKDTYQKRTKIKIAV